MSIRNGAGQMIKGVMINFKELINIPEVTNYMYEEDDI